jgi:hypothetical protein
VAVAAIPAIIAVEARRRREAERLGLLVMNPPRISVPGLEVLRGLTVAARATACRVAALSSYLWHG